MEPSNPSNYDMRRTFETILKRMNERFPDTNKKDQEKFAFFLAMNLHRQQVEPLLKIVRIVDECLDIVGAPKVTSTGTGQEYVELVTLRMALALEESELNVAELQGLHRLLTTFGVPSTNSQGHNLLLADRFRGFADVLRTIHETTDKLAQTVIDGLLKDHIRQLEAAAAAAIDDTQELMTPITLPSLQLPPVVKSELERTIRMSLPPTSHFPLIDLLDPEFAAIRDQLQAAHAENLRLSEQVARLSKTVQEKSGHDKTTARRIEVALKDLSARLKASEQARDRDRREHRQQRDADRREMSELKAAIDRLSAGLASDNKETARQLIEEALDTASAREAMKAMDRQETEDAKANKAQRLASPISQPIPQGPSSDKTRDTSDVRITMHPWSPAGTGTKTAPKPVQAPIRPTEPSRRQIRAAQLDVMKRRSIEAGRPTPAPQREKDRLGLVLASIAALLVFGGLGLNALSTKSFVTTDTAGISKDLQSLQETYLRTAEAIREKYPNVDLASTAVKAVTEDNNAIYANEALREFDAWMRSGGRTEVLRLAADSLQKAGGFRYTKDRFLDTTYGIHKDGSKIKAWQLFVTVLYHERGKNENKSMHNLEYDTFWRLDNWLQGFSLGPKSGDGKNYYEETPPEDIQHAFQYLPLLSDPPGPASNCLLPPAAAQLKGKVPASAIKAHACPVQYLNTEVIADYEKMYPGQKELILKVPETYWNRYCVVPAAINAVHNKTNVTVKELRAKACKS